MKTIARKIFFKIYFFLLKIKYRKNHCPYSLNRDWSSVSFNRIAAVHLALRSFVSPLEVRYLEIGCDSNILFDSVSVVHKIGVDPNRGGTHRMTSDDFFSSNSQIFDLVFIDGLHEYSQVHRDLKNALTHLSVNGWVLLHDFLPNNWLEEHVPPLQPGWVGDSWKLSTDIMKATGLSFHIINADNGIACIKKLTADFHLPELNTELLNKRFDHYLTIAGTFPIISHEESYKIFNAS